MKTFTIDQAYNCMNWRTVLVQAESVERAIELANEADVTFPDPDSPEVPADQEGGLSCGNWSSDGGGGECGPTFTEHAVEGNFEDAGPFSAIHDTGMPGLPVPEREQRFAMEWPDQVEKLRDLTGLSWPRGRSFLSWSGRPECPRPHRLRRST